MFRSFQSLLFILSIFFVTFPALAGNTTVLEKSEQGLVLIASTTYEVVTDPRQGWRFIRFDDLPYRGVCDNRSWSSCIDVTMTACEGVVGGAYEYYRWGTGLEEQVCYLPRIQQPRHLQDAPYPLIERGEK